MMNDELGIRYTLNLEANYEILSEPNSVFGNPVKDKSFVFALDIIKISHLLQYGKKECVLSKQLFRSGTAIGALVRSQNAESKADFIHKLAIAQKECDETIYWIDLPGAASIIPDDRFTKLHAKAEELPRLLRSIVLTTKNNLNASK